jgi:hypothetical protein
VTRHYEFELNYEGAVTGWSTDAFVRARTVADTDGSMTVPGDDTLVRAVDTVMLPPLLSLYTDTGTFTVTSTLTVQEGDSSTFQVSKLYTEPQAPGPGSDADFPAWFAENGWAQYVYVKYADGYSPTGSGSCTPGTDCVSVYVWDDSASPPGSTVTRSDAFGAVAMSGELVGTQGLDQATPAGAGFDGRNALSGPPLEVERRRPVAGFNDQVRLTACVSGACR